MNSRRNGTTWRSYVAELPAWTLVIGAMAVSFWSQAEVVRAHSLANWEALIFAGSSDAGTVACLFMAREASHRGTPTWGAWVLSLACAAVSIEYNVVRDWGDWLGVEAHVWMPLFAIGIWWWLLHGRHRRWSEWIRRGETAGETVPQPSHGTSAETPPSAEMASATPDRPALPARQRPSRSGSRHARHPARRSAGETPPDAAPAETPDVVLRLASHLAKVRDEGGAPERVSVRQRAAATGVPVSTVGRQRDRALAELARETPANDETPALAVVNGEED
jgi:hypothetical protein